MAGMGLGAALQVAVPAFMPTVYVIWGLFQSSVVVAVLVTGSQRVMELYNSQNQPIEVPYRGGTYG